MTLNYSVLMSVYNKEHPVYLKRSVESMLNQTVVTDDFVIVCDGPLNSELNSVISYFEVTYPCLFNIIRLDENHGLGFSLNIGLHACRNELVARMDSDDISVENRCEQQLAIFLGNKNIDIVSGTIIEFSGEENNIVGKRQLPEKYDEIVAFSRRRNPFNHPAVMFKKDAVCSVGGYNEDYHFLEDYYLWVRMLSGGCYAYNCVNPILKMRVSDDMYARRGGLKYAMTLLSFNRYMLDIEWIGKIDFLYALIHSAVCIMPVCFRKAIYKVIR